MAAALSLGATLRNHGGEAVTAGHLERVCPEWRDALPIPLEDDAAVALITGLVAEAVEGPRDRTLAVRLELVVGEGALRLLRRLELPARLSEQSLRESFGVSGPLPGRCDLLVMSPEGPRLLAELIHRDEGLRVEARQLEIDAWTVPLGPTGHCREDWASREITDPQALERSLRAPLLRLRGGGRVIGELLPQDAAFSPDAPVAFVKVASAEGEAAKPGALRGTWRLLGEAGSTLQRDREGLVYVPQGGRWNGGEAVDAPSLVRWPLTVERLAVRTDGGEVEAAFQRGGTSDIRRLVPSGATLGVHGGSPVYLVPPSLTGGQGGEAFAGCQLEYRDGESWRPLRACVGPQRVLARARDGDAVLARFRLDVWLDAGRQPIRFEALGARRGRLLMRLGDKALVGVRTPAVSVTEVARQAAWRVFELEAEGRAPSRVEVVVGAKGGSPLTLSLPFPKVEAGFFFGDGTPVPVDKPIPVAALHRVSAEVSAGPERPLGAVELRARLVGQDIQDARLAEVDLPPLLPTPGTPQASLDLVGVEPRLRRLLAMSTDQAAQVNILLDAPGQRPQRLTVSRYEGGVRWDREAGGARVSGGTGLLRVDAVAPAAPGHLVRFSEPEPDGDGLWRPTEPLTPGVWIVLARRAHDGHMILRPALARIDGDMDVTDDPLQAATLAPTFGQREKAIRRVLDAMRDDPTHPSWDLLDSLVDSLGKLPADLFEVIRHLADDPAALALALFRTPEPRRVVPALAQLPFHWAAFPIKALVQGWRAHREGTEAALTQSLRAVSDDEVFIRSTIDQVLEGTLRVIREALRSHLQSLELTLGLVSTVPPEILPSEDAEAATLVSPAALSGLETRMTLTRKGHQEGLWPRLPALEAAWARRARPAGLDALLSRTPEGQRGVLVAPLLAACASVFDVPVSRAVAFELRSAQSFDHDYFVAAHRLTLKALFGP